MARLWYHWQGHDGVGNSVTPKVPGHHWSALMLVYVKFGLTKQQIAEQIPGLPSDAAQDASNILDVLNSKTQTDKAYYLQICEALQVLTESQEDTLVHTSPGGPLIEARILTALELSS